MNRLYAFLAEAFSSAIDGVITALFIISVFQILVVSIYAEKGFSSHRLKVYLSQKLNLDANPSWAEIDEMADKRSSKTLYKNLKLNNKKTFPEISVIQEHKWPRIKFLDQA